MNQSHHQSTSTLKARALTLHETRKHTKNIFYFIEQLFLIGIKSSGYSKETVMREADILIHEGKIRCKASAGCPLKFALTGNTV